MHHELRLARRVHPIFHLDCAPAARLAWRPTLSDYRWMIQTPEQLHIQFQDAFNRHDLDAVLALYEPEAVLASAQPPAVGSDAIRDAYRGFFAMRPTIELQTVVAHRAGDLALLHGKWVLRGTGPDGGEIRMEGKNTETARRQPDGGWLFVIDNPYAP